MRRIQGIACVVVLVSAYALDAFGQAASATWPLTSVTTTSVSTSGDVTGQDEFFGGMVINNYAGPNSSQRVTTTDGSWPANSDQDANRYIQFAVSPNPTYDFTVTSIALDIGAAGGGNMRANIWYSTDPAFATGTKLNASPLVLPNGSLLSPSPSYNPNLMVGSTQTLYVRIYPWYTSASSGKYICLQNVVISGTAVTASAGISISVSALSSFQHVLGTPSAVQSYTVSAVNLLNDVIVTPPPGFEISTDSGSTWNGNATPVTLTVVGGEIPGQPITISTRMNGNAPAPFSGNIVHTSTGATTRDVAVDGVTLALEPGVQSSISFGAVTGNSIVVNFSGGNGTDRILVARAGSAVTFTPTDGIAVSGVDSNFGLAPDQGGGNKIVYNGTGTSETVIGLASNTTYHFAVYEYNVGTGNSHNYNTVSPGTGTQTTLAVPTIITVPSSLAFGPVLVDSTSAEKIFALSGSTLSPASGDITLTAPSGYEVSLTSGSGFGSSAQVAYSGGALGLTVVHVHFKPAAVQSYNGNITCEGGSAPTQSVAVTGNGSTPARSNELQAENGIFRSAYVRTQYAGYTGTGYVDIANKTDAALEILFRRATAATDTVKVYYALGASSRAYEVSLNGSMVGSQTFTGTGSWTSWSSVVMMVPLQAGVNRLKFRATTNTSENANIDRIYVGGQQATPVYKLSLLKSGSGSVNASPLPSDSLFDDGASVVLTASPDAGYNFLRWGGSETGTSTTLNITMNTHKVQVGIMMPVSAPSAFPYEATPKGFASVSAFGQTNGTTGGTGAEERVVYVDNTTELTDLMFKRVDPNHVLNFPPMTVYIVGRLTKDIADNMIDVKDLYNVSIIGVGSDATMDGIGFAIIRSQNVIVRNIKFMNSLDDGISVQANDVEGTGNHIWIDHCTFIHHYDGALDVTHTASYVTLSWNYFYNHDKTCLMGHSDGQSSDVSMKVTYHHNYFDSTVQRHPRVRYGKAHVYNNYYRNNPLYGVSSNLEADVLVEGNYFANVPIPTETSRDGSPAGDLVERYNTFVNCGPPGTRGTAFEASTYYGYSLDLANAIPQLLTDYSGSGKYDFSNGITIPLPVQFSSFTGVFVNSNAVQLDWGTVSETNNLGFYVQRRLSTSGTFTELPNSFVPGHGTTSEPQVYQFIDTTVTSNSWYYRLRVADINSNEHFTDPILVSPPTGVKETVPAAFHLSQNYPNPFNPETSIEFSVASTGQTTVLVYNTLGQQVASVFNGVAEAGRLYVAKLNGVHLASGVYFYRLQSGGRSDLRKLVLLK